LDHFPFSFRSRFFWSFQLCKVLCFFCIMLVTLWFAKSILCLSHALRGWFLGHTTQAPLPPGFYLVSANLESIAKGWEKGTARGRWKINESEYSGYLFHLLPDMLWLLFHSSTRAHGSSQTPLAHGCSPYQVPKTASSLCAFSSTDSNGWILNHFFP
jgi:hypothetical protein